MGMYDEVNYSCPCPACGGLVTGFQSRSGPCCLDTLEVWQVDRFYSFCPKCGAWVEFVRKLAHPPPAGTPEEYVAEFFEVHVEKEFEDTPEDEVIIPISEEDRERFAQIFPRFSIESPLSPEDTKRIKLIPTPEKEPEDAP